MCLGRSPVDQNLIESTITTIHNKAQQNMPCTKDLNISTSHPVLVTGATGYVAGVLIAHLLEKGLTVHGTVRDPTKTDRLKHLNDAAAKTKGTIKFFKADLLAEGSYDEAAKGCSVIFHTASPFALNVKDPDKDLIEPALRGTENVLTTANKTPSVKRVVLTSSCVAIYDNAKELQDIPGGVFTEENWNRGSTREDNPYPLSKTLAEQKAWVMAGSQTGWKLVVCNPGFVMGPGLKYHAGSESYDVFKQFYCDGMPFVPAFPMPVVDVRDIADGHIAAAFLPEASGRYILSGSNTTFLAMGQAIAEKYGDPSLKLPSIPTSGPPMPKPFIWALGGIGGLPSRKFIADNLGYEVNFDNSKAKTELGMDFYPLTKTMQDMYQHFLDEKIVVAKE